MCEALLIGRYSMIKFDTLDSLMRDLIRRHGRARELGIRA
jgi:hypothetical protein